MGYLVSQYGMPNGLLHTLIAALGLVLFGLSGPAMGMDELRLQYGISTSDQRQVYPVRVLTAAMEATVQTDGPYRMVFSHYAMNRRRSLEELQTGERINVATAATRPEWEERAIPVRIPILKGLLGYRLFLIRGQDAGKFKGLQSLDDLKRLRAGGGRQWSFTDALERNGFTLVTSQDYDGLFIMLDFGRFDYFPRGVNEIYQEYETRRMSLPSLAIEPTLALYCPLPSYFFISPRHPKLADRIRRGMEIILENGVLDGLFEAYYRPVIERSKLKDRTIFRIDNPELPAATPLDRPELWFRP